MLREQGLQNKYVWRLSIFDDVAGNPSVRTRRCLVTQCVSARWDAPYFNLLHEKIKEHDVEDENTYNMNEKGFMIGVIKKGRAAHGPQIITGYAPMFSKHAADSPSYYVRNPTVNTMFITDGRDQTRVAGSTIARGREGLTIAARLRMRTGPFFLLPTTPCGARSALLSQTLFHDRCLHQPMRYSPCRPARPNSAQRQPLTTSPAYSRPPGCRC